MAATSDSADFEFAKGGPVSAAPIWGESKAKLDREKAGIDGLAFLGLSLSRNHCGDGVGHTASVTRQSQFDFNRVQDRSYKWFDTTDHHGWLLGGGEAEDSWKMPNPDSAHCEIVRFGTFQRELGGLPMEDVLKAVADGSLLIPEFRVVPTAVERNPDTPPEVELRFDLLSDPQTNVEDWANWQLPFVMNQIYELFQFPARYTPGPFHATMVRKAGFRDAAAWKAYFAHCSAVVAEWRARGPVLLEAEEKDPSTTGAVGGLYFFRDANRVVGYVEPNFLPPYNTPEKRALIQKVLSRRWDQDRLEWVDCKA